MSFVGNQTAYATGKVPRRDLKRLNGPKEDYPAEMQNVIFVGIPCVLAVVGFTAANLQVSRYIVLPCLFGALVLGCVVGPVWTTCNPRRLNRRTWDEYREAGRLFTRDDVAFRLVMSPAVIELCCAVDVGPTARAVDAFLEWYAQQPFASDKHGPIRRSEAPALAEVRWKLVMGVANALPPGKQLSVADHVNQVLAELHTAYCNLLDTEVECLDKKFQAADDELRYQSRQLAALAT